MSWQTLRGTLTTVCLIGMLSAWSVVTAHAQSEDALAPPAVASILKSTALDPTMYVPAILTDRTLVKTLGWAERIGVASLMSYRLSAPHYRQVGLNVQMAAQLGGR